MKMQFVFDQSELKEIVLQHVRKTLETEVGFSQDELKKLNISVRVNIWQDCDEAGFENVVVYVKGA